jgi:predicted secreted hydrolase
LTPDAPGRGSDWGASQAYLAHLAVTDARGGRFYFGTRTSRGALGLAGAQADPFRVFVEDWEARSDRTSTFPLHLRAEDEDVALDLHLESAKPPVLQGERGLSRKGPEPGNASYYYSLTRMPVRGTIRLRSERFEVEGLAWMDREWSTAAVGKDLAGWDWFALQLEDGRELMYYRLRRRDGTADPFSAGVVVDARGGARTLTRDGVRLEATGVWRSRRSGVEYPAGWRLTDTAGGLELTITPRLADQELDVSPRYWEGAVEVRGIEGGQPVAGHGYVELVGYGEAGRGRQTTR